MRFALALTLMVGVAVGSLQAQEASSSSNADAPQLTDDEFQRLYDRMLGTWHFQPDKSTEAQPGVAPRYRWYVTYEPDGEKAIRYTNRNIDPSGEETVSSSRQVLDGSLSEGGAIARLPVNENTISTTIGTASAPQGRNTQFFSADGQRMTVIHRRVDDQGEHITRVHVWDKIDKIPE
jgi:hypothetical protein